MAPAVGCDARGARGGSGNICRGGGLGSGIWGSFLANGLWASLVGSGLWASHAGCGPWNARAGHGPCGACPAQACAANAAAVEAFDATLSMFERLHGHAIPWQWADGTDLGAPIRIEPRAGETDNAAYLRGEKVLKFFHFLPPGWPECARVYTCRSADIVVHETAHAVLDAFRPHWLVPVSGSGAPSPQTLALHEAFCDLADIFFFLSQLDLVEYVVALTGADLHVPSPLSSLGEQYGLAFGLTNGFRTALNELTMDDVSTDCHALAQVFTGAVYDSLADIYESALHSHRRESPAGVLAHCAHDLARVVVEAFFTSPADDAVFSNVANEIVQGAAAHDVAWRTPFQRHFERRKILVPAMPSIPLSPGRPAAPALEALPSGRRGTPARIDRCCGTIRGHLHR
ncbi:MAG: hypothetical protein IPK82_34325 [Polyangiaceae bacterium]|nr:hypothetical protein [Polyangiaceae bacterium]